MEILTATHPEGAAGYTAQEDPARALLHDFSMEITPRHASRASELAERLTPGTRVYIALIDPLDGNHQVAAATALASVGLVPVPHVPARLIRDAAELDDRLSRLAGEAGVDQALVLGGGFPDPVGEFTSAMDVLRTGLFARHGINRLGFAGHPEGNPDITRIHGKEMLLQALKEKQSFALESGAAAYLATQFLFQAEPVAAWARGLRVEGITMPLHVGIPGPATIKTLVKYATMCGIGASARLIRKQAMSVTRLLTVATPDALIDGLGRLQSGEPELGIAGIHLYPFGGYDKLFAWLGERYGL